MKKIEYIAGEEINSDKFPEQNEGGSPVWYQH